MTGRNKTLDIAFVVLGLIIVSWSIAVWHSVTNAVAQWAVTSIILGGVMVLFGAAGLLGRGVPHGDERTRKLGAYAAAWSWFSALAVASVLYLLEHQGVIAISADQALEAMLVTLLGTIVLFEAYYRKRVDTE